MLNLAKNEGASKMRRKINTQRKEQSEKYQLLAIQHLQQNLMNKKQELLEHQQALVNASTEAEQKTFQFRIDHTQRVILKIQSELHKKGIVEKRGRPKKAAGTTYKEQRKKFTAHLQLTTIDYLQHLKANGHITNISAFLDELVATHEKKNSE